MIRTICFLFLFISACALNGIAQTGSSCSNPYIIYPATTCNNTCGAQYCGNMQCPTGNCGAYVTMAGSSGGLNPGCTSDNESSQSVMWLKIYATANNFTINNGKPYVGGGAANANTKDYIVYSGTCGSLTQIACYTLAGNATATVTGLTAGQVYYIMASPANVNTTATAISTCITSTVGYSPPGDLCSAPVNLSTNVTYTYTNAGATPQNPICSGSVENEVWYKWCAPSNWPLNQKAYVSVYNQICNSTQGLQLTVWNTNSTCPASAASPNVVCQNPGTLTQYYYQWVAVANQCYYITIDGFAGTACQYRITVGSIIALPVELIRFEAKQKNEVIELSWTTASETNNDHFILERSADGINFNAIVKLQGNGNSTETLNYSYTDEQPISGVNYYRLKQVDFDGSSTSSDIIAVNSKSKLSKFSASMSATSDAIEVIHVSDYNGNSQLKLVSVKGNSVIQKEVETKIGMNNYSLSTANLPRGMYFLILENKFESLKLVLNHWASESR